MSSVGSKISKRVFSGNVTKFNKGSLPQLYEGFGLLVGLQTLPASDLAKQCIYRVSGSFDEIIQGFNNIELSPKLQAQFPDADTPNRDIDRFTVLNRDYLLELSLFADCFDSFFLTRKTCTQVLSGLESLKHNVFAHSMTDFERTTAKEDLSRFLTEKTEAYFKFLTDHLLAKEKNFQFDENVFTNQASSAHHSIKILGVLRNDLVAAITLKQLTKIDERISELTISVLDRIIQGVFQKVVNDFFGYFVLSSETATSLR